jgi:uncharacterized protein (TIGR03435 family)
MTLSTLWNWGSAAALLNHLWQSTVMVLIAWLVTLALRPNPARVRYWVWMFASVKFLVPFALLASLGTWSAKPIPGPQIGSALYTMVDEISQPLQQTQAPAVVAGHSLYRTHLFEFVLPILAIVWLCGVVSVLAVWMMRRRRVARIAADAQVIYEGREVTALRRAERNAGIRSPIPVLLSPRATEPGIFGVIRPVLLWPQGISDRLTDAQIEAIAAHEVEHVRRRDNLTAAIHTVVEAVFWFHPAVRWMTSRLMEERERACDEKVLEQSAQPEVYAESILKVCAFCLEPSAPCVAGVSGSDLKERVLRIMTNRAIMGLSLGRRAVLCVVAGSAIAMPLRFGALHAMQGPAPSPPSSDVSPDVPRYDVATIKPSPSSSDGREMMMFSSDGVSISGVPLQMIVREAFHVEEDRIVGAPGWVKTNRYDIQAKVAPEDAPKLEKLKRDQRQSMLLPLLVERFNLKYHHETRELPSYALVVAKGGPKLKPSAVPDAPPNPKPPDAGASPRPGDGPGNNPPRRMMRLMGRGHLEAEGGNTEILARVLSQQLGRTVVDKTGLTGLYDYTLQWTPDDAPPSGPGGGDGGPPHNEGGTDAAGPSLFTAVQEQLGLKLQSEKGQADVIVIDHIDLPSEN